MSAVAVGGVATCPSVDRLLAFAGGELADAHAVELEAHIDGCDDCRTALSAVARGDTPPRFGRYRLDTVLGSGGMGIVYRAWDPQLARAVAIKVVRRAGEDAGGRARLAAEARSLARLSHRHVCQVYDVGTDGDEVWVAMELIDGVTLRQWAGERGDPRAVLEALLGAADGLAAAHAAGLVHRDVKPENVLVARDGRAVVTDFGLAHADDRVDPKASTISGDEAVATGSGRIAGTPAYLAPEQLTGEEVDGRADQFAWAVMAWELLAGVRPFPAVLSARLDAIRVGVTAPASMSPALATVLRRALSVAPRDRFADLRELAAAIRAIDQAAATAAAPAIARSVTETGAARRGRGPALVAGGLVLAALGAVAIARPWRGDSNELAPAVAPPPAPTPSLSLLAEPLHVPTPPPTPAKTLAIAAKPKPPTVIEPKPAPAPAPKPEPEPSLHDLTDDQALDLVDPPLSRATAIAVLDMECHIPFDVAHPDPLIKGPTADWGRVTRTEEVVARLGDRDLHVRLIEVAGVRATYRFNESQRGRMPAKVGDLLLVCPIQPDEVYTLPATWSGLSSQATVVHLSSPPPVAALAAQHALHVHDYELVGKLPADRPYVVHARIKAAEAQPDDGADPNATRWDAGMFSIELPAGVSGASRVKAGASLWLVVEAPRRDGKHPRVTVVRATAVLDELLP